MTEVFDNAGRKPGLEIWRVENFTPVPVKSVDYGKFYTGDSYVVLSTKKTGEDLSWDIHFWLGKETSQDEAGSAAILSVELDELLNGFPVQHRELQEYESALFLSYFKSGIRYLSGGVATGFHHVDPTKWENVLYHVKGKRNVRVKKVQAHVSSMNRGDCFILDTRHDIFVYVGKGAKRMERLRAISAANMIRDQDHAGRARVKIVDEFSEEGEKHLFFRRLGSGSEDEVADESSGGEDEEFEEQEEAAVALYKVSDNDGEMKFQHVAKHPLSHQYLDTTDCFVLDAGTAGVFVWIGARASKEEKSEAVKRAQQFLRENRRPWWTKIQRVVEGGEPAAFKQYFIDWRDEGVGHMFSMPRLLAAGMHEDTAGLSAEELRRLVRKEGPAVGFMPDNGAGDVEVWRIEDFEMVPVPKEAYGRFFGGDSYVIRYTCAQGGRTKHIIYFWQGSTSSQDEKAAAAVHAVRLDEQLGGRAVQVRVTQGHEPRHFLTIFKGKMIVFLGGRHSGFRNVRDYDTYDKQTARLFQVRGTCEQDVRVLQVPEKTENLNSDDAFVVDTSDKTYVWFGQESSPAERAAAIAASRLVSPDHEPIKVLEGSEPDELWRALGGPGTYTYAGHHAKHPALPARLFHCQITLRGKFRVNEIDNYSQEDLAEDDVMVLDSGDEVYVWVGARSSDQEKELSLKMAEDYLKLSPVHRHRSTIIQVKQDEEPAGFTTLFPDWDEDFWKGQPSYDDIKRQVSSSNPMDLSVDIDSD